MSSMCVEMRHHPFCIRLNQSFTIQCMAYSERMLRRIDTRVAFMIMSPLFRWIMQASKLTKTGCCFNEADHCDLCCDPDTYPKPPTAVPTAVPTNSPFPLP